MHAPPSDRTRQARDAMALFERWLALAEPGRRALLDDLSAREPGQYQRLQALIDADEGGFLETPAAQAPERGGQRLGPWQLQEVVGSGGMGEVWRATRSDGLYTGQAAVKLQRGAAAGALANARFAREAEFLARVSHPHVAQLLDAGVADDGTRYLVLEYVHGDRIDRWCDQRRLAVDARLALFQQVCEAVAFAHAQRVVHRDLKPANMLVTEQGHLKLLDFGVAKLLGDGGASDLTHVGAAGLTPEYAAPEQVEGGAITPGTDVYALGVLLFMLLTGQRPYGDESSTPAQLARAIVEAEPARASAVAAAGADVRATTPRALRQRLRGDLDRIVARALRKVPAERYATAQALADDIGRHLRNEPVLAREPSWAYRAAKFARRQRVPLAAVAVLLLALAGGGADAAAGVIALAVAAGVAATLWQARRARQQARVALAEAAKARAIQEFLLEVFKANAIGGSDAQARQDTTARELLEEGGRRLLADRALPTDVRAELLGTLATLHDELGLVPGAYALSSAALELQRPAGESSASFIDAMATHGALLGRMGRTDEGRALVRDAIGRAERQGLQQRGHHGEALYALGYMEHLAGDLDAAGRHLRQAVDLLERHDPGHGAHIKARVWLGNTQLVREDFAGAVATFRATLPLAEAQPRLRDYSVGSVQYALYDALSTAGWLLESAPALDLAIGLWQRALGERHPDVWMLRVVRARLQQQLGQPAAARAELARCADAARDDSMPAGGNLNDRVAAARAFLDLLDGDVEAGLEANTPLVQRYAQQGGQTRGHTLLRQSELLLLAGRPEAAIEPAQRALELMDREVGALAIVGKTSRCVLAEALAETAPAQARALFEQALGPAQADAYGDPPPVLAWQRWRAHAGLAALLQAQAPEEALRHAQAVVQAVAADTPVLRPRLALAKSRSAEAQAFRLLGNGPAAQAAGEAAVALLQGCQAPHSPRLDAARRARADAAAMGR